MKAWRYCEPGLNDEPLVITMSEADILATYYHYWQEQMRRIGKADEISEQGCIDDWVVVHWAEPAPPQEEP